MNFYNLAMGKDFLSMICKAQAIEEMFSKLIT